MKSHLLILACATLVTFSSQSWASDPIIHAGEDSQLLLARVAAASERDSSELRSVTFIELTLGMPPMMMGEGRVQSCQGAPRRTTDIEQALDRAERALSYFEIEKARAHLQVAETTIGCLDEPADRRSAARVFFLEGFIHFSNGSADQALESWRLAHQFRPGLAWDSYLPPEGLEVFEEAARLVAGQSDGEQADEATAEEQEATAEEQEATAEE
ncbi:MAG: hypothetical protein QGG40_12220, partial [Myxococcota bacterium]|nr:hypothetical protein [Myxococcota bacterium]